MAAAVASSLGTATAFLRLSTLSFSPPRRAVCRYEAGGGRSDDSGNSPGRYASPTAWRRFAVPSKRARSVALLNAITVIFASEIPVLKEVETMSDPAVFNMVRFAVAAIPFVPYALRACGDRRTRSAGLELGFWVSSGYLAQAVGLLSSGAGKASFLSAFTVIVVPIIDGMFGASVPAITWFGASVSLLGVALLECSSSPPCVGDVLNFISAVFFGVHMLRTEHISQHTRKDKFLALISFEICAVALASVLWFLVRNGSELLRLDPSSCTFGSLADFATSFPWIPALYTGLFSTVLCLWAEIHAMVNVSATETAVVYGMEPVWGAVFAWFLLDERWDTAAWIGATLVICGSLTVQILGSTPSETGKKMKEEARPGNQEKNMRKRSHLSFSAVIVDSRKNIPSRLKR